MVGANIFLVLHHLAYLAFLCFKNIQEVTYVGFQSH
jgi:hypothetical protein